MPDPGYMFKVDLTGFADGTVAGVESKVSRVETVLGGGGGGW